MELGSLHSCTHLSVLLELTFLNARYQQGCKVDLISVASREASKTMYSSTWFMNSGRKTDSCNIHYPLLHTIIGKIISQIGGWWARRPGRWTRRGGLEDLRHEGDGGVADDRRTPTWGVLELQHYPTPTYSSRSSRSSSQTPCTQGDEPPATARRAKTALQEGVPVEKEAAVDV